MTVFKLPDLGEGLQEAEIVKWRVAEGDSVTEGDAMVEMSTDKAVVEVPAPYTGKVVKLHGKEGDIVKTGAELVTFEVEGEKPAEGAKGDGEEKKEQKPKAKEKKEKPPKKPEEKAEISGEGEVFKLPDLGEGLQEGEIVKWAVGEGDSIAEGDTMVEMSTDKAVVEVPAPFSGKVVKLYGKEGDIIKTGAPLIAIDTGKAPAKTEKKEEPEKKETREEPVTEAKGDSGSVVGEMTVGDEVSSESRKARDGVTAAPAARALARKLKVNLGAIEGSGKDGEVTLQDVKNTASGKAPDAKRKDEPGKAPPKDVSVSPSAKATARALGLDIAAVAPRKGKVVTKGDVLAAARRQLSGAPRPQAAPAATTKEVKAAPKVRALAREKGVDLRQVNPTGHQGNVTLEDVKQALAGGAPAVPGVYSRPERPYEVSGEPQRVTGPRRVMAQTMAKANSEVCHTSLFDEVSIARWGEGADITVRLMRAVIAACFAEPAMNAWFDGEKLEKTVHKHVSLGVAVDSPKGLFVPVIKGADGMDGAALRKELNRLREAIADGSIKSAEMSGGTITLSNFGMIAGRFATPIIVPPEVAIVGIGGLYEKLVMTEKGIENQRFIPVSLTFDHRASTGGEAARFMKAMLNDLALAF